MPALFPSRFQPPLGPPRRGARQRVLKKELQLDGQVVKAWNELLDPNITAHSQPVGLRKGTLFVNVDSSPWLSEIVRYRRREILERLQHTFGRELVAKISFRIG